MKIYFAGSIRGGREEVETYQKLIPHLRKYGQVLSEHVGYDDLEVAGETAMNDEDIFRQDLKWLSECDIVIAEVTIPSLGVGYELGKAESMQKPVLCLFNPTKGGRLSAMIAGNNTFRVISYEAIQEAFHAIDHFIENNLN